MCIYIYIDMSLSLSICISLSLYIYIYIYIYIHSSVSPPGDYFNLSVLPPSAGRSPEDPIEAIAKVAMTI